MAYLVSSVLLAGWLGVWILVGAFSVHVWTGPEVHPVFCTMGTGSLCQGICCEGTVLATHPRLAPVLLWMGKSLLLPPLCVFMPCYSKNFPFTYGWEDWLLFTSTGRNSFLILPSSALSSWCLSLTANLYLVLWSRINWALPLYVLYTFML